MINVKSANPEKVKDNDYLLINLIFGFFPISFAMGSLIINVNFLIFCILGIYYLKSKILTIKLNFTLKIIFLFFLVVLIASGVSLIKFLYFDGYGDNNLSRFLKSILFFRFFLFLIIIFLLNKFDILKFKYFFIFAFIASIVVSIDIIFQYFVGYNTIGLENQGTRNSGFFGDEHIAGGYILRFSIFAILFLILFFKDKKYIKLLSTLFAICILGAGILFSGNRMPLVLFFVGLALLFFSNFKIKQILFLSLFSFILLFTIVLSSDNSYKNLYHSFYGNAKNVLLGQGITKWRKVEHIVTDENVVKNKTTFYEAKWETEHRRLYLTAIDTWKFSKVIGNGIKSFREDCHRLREQPDVSLEENLYPDKKNRLCSNHPHNYYFEMLTETGISGLSIIFVLACIFIIFIFKNYKLVKETNIENFVLYSAILSLILETLPLRSSGSIFTTNNTTYIILITSIILCYKKLLKTKIE